MRYLPFLFICHLVDKKFDLLPVPVAVEKHAIAPQSIPACASCFLVVGFKVFWEVMMYHKTDVGFVDAHPESDSGDKYLHIVFYELILVRGPDTWRQACMIRKRPESGILQVFCQGLNTFPAVAVNYA